MPREIENHNQIYVFIFRHIKQGGHQYQSQYILYLAYQRLSTEPSFRALGAGQQAVRAAGKEQASFYTTFLPPSASPTRPLPPILKGDLISFPRVRIVPTFLLYGFFALHLPGMVLSRLTVCTFKNCSLQIGILVGDTHFENPISKPQTVRLPSSGSKRRTLRQLGTSISYYECKYFSLKYSKIVFLI